MGSAAPLGTEDEARRAPGGALLAQGAVGAGDGFPHPVKKSTPNFHARPVRGQGRDGDKVARGHRDVPAGDTPRMGPWKGHGGMKGWKDME